MTTRQTILDGAVELTSRLGFNALSLAALATSVDMSKSGLFAHFRSKEQLQLQTLEHARRRFEAIVVRPVLTGPDGLPRLRAILDRWLTWSDTTLSGGCLFVAAATELDDQPGALRDDLVRAQQDWQAFLIATIEAATQSNSRTVDASQVAFEFQSLLLGHQYASRLTLGPNAATQRTQRAFERLIAPHLS